MPGVPHPTEPVELLYVGTAPRDAKSKSHLRKRLGNHHRAAIGKLNVQARPNGLPVGAGGLAAVLD
ncbi:MAG: hypothetical protein H0U25_12980 [Thermoleophilaceae bacterium]|nr:hypothetical protein [Thermoleophilaceae bacterium]